MAQTQTLKITGGLQRRHDPDNDEVTYATLTAKNLTLGSLVFAGAGGLLAQDNAKLFWDDVNKNFGLGTNAEFGSGEGVLGISDAVTVPTTNPTGGGILYSDGGAGKWRSPSGTVTTFGPADPHCPRCEKDFACQWENPKYGKLAICAWCLSEALGKIGLDVVIFKESPPFSSM